MNRCARSIPVLWSLIACFSITSWPTLLQAEGDVEQWMERAKQQNDPADAMDTLEMALAEHPTSRRLLSFAAIYSYRHGITAAKANQPEVSRQLLFKSSEYCQRLLSSDEADEATRKLAGGVANALAGFAKWSRQANLPGTTAKLLEECVALRRRLNLTADQRLAQALNGLGALHHSQANYFVALDYYREAVQELRTAAQAPPDLAICLTNLGASMRKLGKYPDARRCYDEAIAILRRHHDGDHAQVANILNNVGLMLEFQGDFGEAKPYYVEAVEILQRLDPDGSPRQAMALHNLGGLYESQNKFELAREHYDDALTMRRRFPPEDHPEVATILSSIGMLLFRQTSYQEAAGFHREALEIRQRLYPASKYANGHPQLALTLDNQGDVAWATGDYREARERYQQALQMRQRLYPAAAFPDGHADLAASLDNLGKLSLSEHAFEEAYSHCTAALRMRSRLAEAFVTVASEAEALNFMATQARSANHLLSIPASQAKPKQYYAEIWSGRRLIQRKMEQRLAHSRAGKSAEMEEYLSLRRRIGQLAISAADGNAAELNSRQTQLRELTREKERLEREFAQSGTTVPASESTSPRDLARRLPPGAIFVDVVRYTANRYDRQRPGIEGEQRRDEYRAFVVWADESVRQHTLGSAEEIDKLVGSWRSDIARGLRSSQAARRLAEHVWSPIGASLTGSERAIYLCVDGALARVPWAAMPISASQVLLEKLAVAMVPSGQFLSEQLAGVKTPQRSEQQMLLVGDVDYRAAMPAGATEQPKQLWPQLSGTRQEIEAISGLAGSRQFAVTTLSQTNATPDSVLQQLPGARWAHFATHGFFADPELRSLLELSEQSFREVGSAGGERTAVARRNPLLLSGLVFASTELPNGQPETLEGVSGNGILTAEAIAGLPLGQMEVAVLSACETGLGEVAGGEGVYGLQRAFHIAGARNVVASLWKVSDKATAALMALFYRKVWVEELPPLEALRQSQLTIYRRPDLIDELAVTRGPNLGKVVKLARNERDEPVETSPTKLWASFTLSGGGIAIADAN